MCFLYECNSGKTRVAGESLYFSYGVIAYSSHLFGIPNLGNNERTAILRLLTYSTICSKNVFDVLSVLQKNLIGPISRNLWWQLTATNGPFLVEIIFVTLCLHKLCGTNFWLLVF